MNFSEPPEPAPSRLPHTAWAASTGRAAPPHRKENRTSSSSSPTIRDIRTALLTGCYPPRVGITKVLFPRDNIGLNPQEVTIADVLKERGYATACIGKWHLGHLPKFLPTNNGFDSYLGIPYSNDMDGVKDKNRNLDRAWTEKDYSPWNVPLMRNEEVIERPADQTKLIERYTGEAVRFIHREKGEPLSRSTGRWARSSRP